jgi:hypothetical protein
MQYPVLPVLYKKRHVVAPNNLRYQAEEKKYLNDTAANHYSGSVMQLGKFK